MEMALSGYSSTSDSGFDIVILDFFFQVSTKDIFAWLFPFEYSLSNDAND